MGTTIPTELPTRIVQMPYSPLESMEVDVIKLRCPDCGTEGEDIKRHGDPAKAVFLEYPCPECCHGKKPFEVWYDRDGNQI